MKILLIDDKEINREAAAKMLSENEVTTVGSYDEAVNLIQESVFDFDIVLVDLMMPASNRTLGDRCEHRRGELMPYGFPLMIQIAINHAGRVKNIAIVSDVNHHNHAMSAALDPLGGYGGKFVEINGIRCCFVHAHIQEDGSKDWSHALERVISPKSVLD